MVIGTAQRAPPWPAFPAASAIPEVPPEQLTRALVSADEIVTPPVPPEGRGKWIAGRCVLGAAGLALGACAASLAAAHTGVLPGLFGAYLGTHLGPLAGFTASVPLAAAALWARRPGLAVAAMFGGAGVGLIVGGIAGYMLFSGGPMSALGLGAAAVAGGGVAALKGIGLADRKLGKERIQKETSLYHTQLERYTRWLEKLGLDTSSLTIEVEPDRVWVGDVGVGINEDFDFGLKRRSRVPLTSSALKRSS